MALLKSATSLWDLWIYGLRGLYDIEHALTKDLPKMAKKATDPELKEVFEGHLIETRNQIGRLEEIFDSLGEKAKEVKSSGIRGISSEGHMLADLSQNRASRDAALISGASAVEHYEMAGYLSAIRWAEELGESNAALLLRESFKEEAKAEENLSLLALSKIDSKALPEDI